MAVLRSLMLPLLLLLSTVPVTHAAPRVAVLDLHDTIQPASLRYLERGLRRAADERAELVVIELDTPGGLAVSLRSMTSAILGSKVPVAVYVTPSGARAASAGFFLLLAADVAAMAPGTNTGAAHPVAMGGSAGSTEMDKAANDAAALARSLAAGRNRSVESAEAAVLKSTAYSAEEARARGLIEWIAVDRDSLLRALDGTTITRFDGSRQTLNLRGARVVPIERTFAERSLAIVADPQIAYLLLMIGAVLLLIEVTSPGLVVPGVAGGLAVLLGLYGFSIVPVNVVGALLVVAGLGMLIAEVFVTSYGLLAVAGIASFVFGSFMLVDTPVPELQLGPEVVLPVAIVLAAATALVVGRAVRSRHAPARSGVEAMIGEAGQVVLGIAPDHDGTVFVHGEIWNATSTEPVSEGARVRVDAIDGLRLHVSPLATRPQGGRP